jgi:hypothetical protein
VAHDEVSSVRGRSRGAGAEDKLVIAFLAGQVTEEELTEGASLLQLRLLLSSPKPTG